MDREDYLRRVESLRIMNEKEIQLLKEENLKLSTQVDHLSREVVRSMVDEDKLRDELALSKKNEEGLKRELDDARKLMAKMTSSTEKINHILSIEKAPMTREVLALKMTRRFPLPTRL